MPETLIKVDLSKSAYDNDKIHNRWHPDIPMVSWVNPGDDFIIETYDWTGGFIKNNDSADDVRDIDLSIVHFLSGPIGVKGAEPGDLLVVDLLDVGPLKESLWGFNGFFSKQNGGGFLTDHFPLAQKSIWDIKGLYTSSRHIPGVNFAGVARDLGCEGETVEEVEHLRDVLKRALNADRPYLVDVIVDTEVPKFFG